MPGKDLESCAELEDPKADNPKAVGAWRFWRANVLYWIGTLIFVPLTGAAALGVCVCDPTCLLWRGLGAAGLQGADAPAPSAGPRAPSKR